jgi:hypothetical protein
LLDNRKSEFGIEECGARTDQLIADRALRDVVLRGNPAAFAFRAAQLE